MSSWERAFDPARVSGSRVRTQLSCVLVLLAAACGEGASSTAASGIPADVAELLVRPGHVVVLRADRSVAAVSLDGEVTAVLGSVPPDIGEPDGVAASADGRLVLVSAVQYDDDAPSTCSGHVLQVLPGERMQRLADGASISLTPDGGQLAYFRYAEDDGFCRRTALVVRDLGDGSETALSITDGAVAGVTPPEWPVSLSPDATEVAHVAPEGAVTTTVASGQTRGLKAAPEGRALAPAWLTDGRLVALHGCCIGSGAVRVDGTAKDLFAVPGPLRSLRAGRDGRGAWFTVEEQGLHHWDGTVARKIFDDALLTSG
jgi:hypothetical protein